MNADADYQRVREIFHAAFAVEGNDRRDVLDSLCAGDQDLRVRVERLLDAQGATLGVEMPSKTLADGPPEIEGYTLRRLLGTGGMGAVYEAVQAQPRRRVAIKVISSGVLSEQLLKRFEREADALGRLAHPGITQVHEYGLIESEHGARPFLVMELVEGARLDEYADRSKLSVEGRLELLARLCDALHHAHDRGVVHRDLKPANVLVTPGGQPKILDFGVARFTGHDARLITLQTETGQLLGTAAYMSPEQTEANPDAIDARSDVYTLGVLLFELLTGRLPHDVQRVPLFDALRMIREDDPTRVTEVEPRISSEVSTIVEKSLERDPARRYQSAESLGADIRRYLASEPILARPPNTLYQLQKFARRNKPVVVATCVVVIALATGLIGTTVALMREATIRRQAETALARSDAAGAFMEKIFMGLEPSVTEGRDTVLMEQMLGRAATDAEEIDIPIVRAEMLGFIGRVYTRVPAPLPALETLTSAAAAYEALDNADPRDLVSIRLSLAIAHRVNGHREEALPILRDVITLLEASDIDAGLLQNAHREAGEVLAEMEREEEALVHLERSIALVDADDPGEMSRVLFLKGGSLRAMERFDEAQVAFDGALEAAVEADDLILQVSVNNSLAIMARQLGRRDEAERGYRAAIEAREQLDPRPNGQVAVLLSNLGRHLVGDERFDEAKPFLDRSLAMHRALYGEEHIGIAFTSRALAATDSALERHDDAIVHSARSVELVGTLRGAGSRAHLEDQLQHASVLVRAGRFEDAIDACRLLATDPIVADEAPFGAGINLQLALAFHGLGLFDDAESAARNASALFGPGPEGASARELLGQIRAAR